LDPKVTEWVMEWWNGGLFGYANIRFGALNGHFHRGAPGPRQAAIGQPDWPDRLNVMPGSLHETRAAQPGNETLMKQFPNATKPFWR
ncbi:hypothetical protein ACP3WZ_25135, partial [Salmonella enterica]|uniref:hypothetical protein n=1 Tax=Salmonella enterica TaxID=28901 RepID=UPI003CF5DFD5